MFERYKLDFARNYDSKQEEERRFGFFISTLKKVEERNAEAGSDPSPDRAVHGITKFADWSPEEFLALRDGVSPFMMPHSSIYPYLPTAPANCSRSWLYEGRQIRQQGA